MGSRDYRGREFREQSVEFMSWRGPIRIMIESGVRSEEEIGILLQTIRDFYDGVLIEGRFNPRSVKLRRFKKELRKSGLAPVTRQFLASLSEDDQQVLHESAQRINKEREYWRNEPEWRRKGVGFCGEENKEFVLTLAEIVKDTKGERISFGDLPTRDRIGAALRNLGLRFNMTKSEMRKAGFDVPPDPKPEKVERVKPKRAYLEIEVKNLDFSVRVSNCLGAFDIKTIRDLVSFEVESLRSMKHWARACDLEVDAKLESFGLRLGMSKRCIARIRD